jgi:hypothetical protein
MRRRPSVAARPTAKPPSPPSPSELLESWEPPDLPYLPRPRTAIEEPLPEPEHPELHFVCSVCRRDIELSERSRIAPSKCRACV